MQPLCGCAVKVTGCSLGNCSGRPCCCFGMPPGSCRKDLHDLTAIKPLVAIEGYGPGPIDLCLGGMTCSDTANLASTGAYLNVQICSLGG